MFSRVASAIDEDDAVAGTLVPIIVNAQVDGTAVVEVALVMSAGSRV